MPCHPATQLPRPTALHPGRSPRAALPCAAAGRPLSRSPQGRNRCTTARVQGQRAPHHPPTKPAPSTRSFEIPPAPFPASSARSHTPHGRLLRHSPSPRPLLPSAAASDRPPPPPGVLPPSPLAHPKPPLNVPLVISRPRVLCPPSYLLCQPTCPLHGGNTCGRLRVLVRQASPGAVSSRGR